VLDYHNMTPHKPLSDVSIKTKETSGPTATHEGTYNRLLVIFKEALVSYKLR